MAAAKDVERVADEQAHEDKIQWEMSLQAGAASRYPEESRRRLAEGQMLSDKKWGQQKKGKPTLTWATMLDFQTEQALKNALALISQRFDEHHPRLDLVTGGPLIEQGGHGMAKPRAVAPQPQLSPAKRGRSPEPAAKGKAAAAKANSASPAPARSQGKKKKREVVEVADSEGEDMSESDIANLSDADFARVLAKQQAKAAKTVAKLKEESKKRRREEEQAEKQAEKDAAEAKAKKTAERMALMAQAKSKQLKDGSDDEGAGSKKGSSSAGRARALGH